MTKSSKPKMGTRVMAAAIAAAALFSGIASTQAALINVDIGNSWGGNDSPLYSGAAVLGASTDQWNKVIGNVTNMALTTSSGSSSAVKLTLTASAYANNAGGGLPTTNNLLRDYAYGFWGTATVTLSGLALNSSYHLVAYSAGDQPGQGGIFSGQLSGSTNPTQRTSYVLNDNYRQNLTASSDGSGDLTFTVAPHADHFAILNGFQIADNASAIPEPASLGLLGMGALALLGRRRK